jgi:alpha-L-fucosidase 2
MKKIRDILLQVILIFVTASGNSQIGNDLKLWYEHAASSWEEALPIGNGRLGAMVFGGPAVDRIQFNEETLWSGRPHDYSNQGHTNSSPDT